MYVVKRSGKRESVHFDKITSRVSKLCYGLDSKVRRKSVADDAWGPLLQAFDADHLHHGRPASILFTHVHDDSLLLFVACGARDHLAEGYSRGLSWSYDL